jgi:nicotinate-nucleotide adenylyltransferase
MTRVALYGGSFDPPHVGHVMATSLVLATQPIDALWMVPCFQHAFDKPLSPFEHRHQMCRLALQSLDPARVDVSDVERQMGGTSHTIDTVKYLQSHYPDTQFDLVVGTDIFEERASWKSFDELTSMCRFIVIGRQDYAPPDDIEATPPLPNVSSTDVRRRLASGEDVSNLTPKAVADYARKHGLYR